LLAVRIENKLPDSGGACETGRGLEASAMAQQRRASPERLWRAMITNTRCENCRHACRVMENSRILEGSGFRFRITAKVRASAYIRRLRQQWHCKRSINTTTQHQSRSMLQDTRTTFYTYQFRQPFIYFQARRMSPLSPSKLSTTV